MALPNIVSAMTVSVGIPDAFSQVQAGNKIYFETEIKWPENTGRKDLRIDYSILDKNKTEIAQLKVLRAIETQVSFMDGIAVPADASSGLYTVLVKIIDYGTLSKEASVTFNVTQSGNSTQTYLIVIIGFLSFISIFVTFELFFLMRKKSF